MVRSNTNNINFINWPVPYNVFVDTIDWIKCCGDQGQLKPGKGNNPTSTQEFITNANIESDNTNFKIYPNPLTGNELNIEFDLKDNNGHIQIFDLMGKKVLERHYSIQQVNGKVKYVLNIDKAKLASGAYLILLDNGSDIYKQTLVIQ